MASLEGILEFLKQEKEVRIKQRQKDMEERTEQRQQDMHMIKEMITKGVHAEVLAAIEPITERQQKVEEDHIFLKQKFNEILEVVTGLKKSSDHHPTPNSQLVSVVLQGDLAAVQDYNVSKMSEIVSAARRTIGFQSIYPEDVDRQVILYGAKDETEARLLAVKEFLKCEMTVSGAVFDKMEVEKIFPPAKEDWDMLYVKFASESSVHTIYKYSRHLKHKQRLVPYIPKHFFPRYKGLESLAYNLRHSESKFKTRVKMGISDLVLYKRKPNEYSWTAIPTPTSIPQVVLTEASIYYQPSSPPPGRPYRPPYRSSLMPDKSINNTGNIQQNLQPTLSSTYRSTVRSQE